MDEEWAREIEEEVKKSTRVVIRDLSNYDWRRSSNGGCYSFTTHYERVNKDRWAVWYSTSAEFDYCEAFGEFRRCGDCPYWDGEECNAERETVSTEEVVAAVIGAYDSDDEVEVEIKGEYREED